MTSLTLAEAHQRAMENPGVILFTGSVIADGASSMARIYSSDEAVYPVGGRKSIDGQVSPMWYEHVVLGGLPFFGPDRKSVRNFFFDSTVIESLGCGAIINVPVRDDGITIGSLNFLDREGAYTDESVVAAVAIAAQLVPAFRSAALSL
ncbi:hypothetical protein EV140_1425 [Microcella alkaliphila]|uniref:GAF domain-containing protein n=1 Tax=Microcella alkaliphila TaxID=279828 RepID=A0A4Q7TMA8_9MICO|nr:GAF domain-containing protein [Microcella alkaliphila]RZT60900.1 hypothetical protein EV140_1425 [Microcella alkaliphila]